MLIETSSNSHRDLSERAAGEAASFFNQAANLFPAIVRAK
jgi:hypothetical protein